MLKNIEDGWLLNPSIRYLPFRALPMLLGQMEAVRRAHNYRPRTWVLPDDLRQPIAARGQLNRQIRVIPNSYLWGVTCYQFINEGEFGFIPVQPADLSIQITDDESGTQIATEFLPAGSLFNPFAQNVPSAVTPVLLTQPKLITGAGLLSVQIANLAETETLCQLQLCFVEPCELRLESEQCR